MKGLTEIQGLRVGHWSDQEAATGCTVVLCAGGAVAGVDVRGTAPGTRETDLLNPICLVDRVHAIVLSGGSAYGLAAADGVMRWLEERGHGFSVGRIVVPIVPAAVLFDLGIGRSQVRPGPEQGYACCEHASDAAVEQGNVGAGTGATAGKILGHSNATKSGLGSAGRKLDEGLIVAALAAVNPFGDVIDPRTQTILAGARHPGQLSFADTVSLIQQGRGVMDDAPLSNTTLGVVATNAALTKAQATKLAQMAQDGLARAIRPAHTHLDGDTIFGLSLGQRRADLSQLGTIAAEVMCEAVVNAVLAAKELGRLPCGRQIQGRPGGSGC